MRKRLFCGAVYLAILVGGLSNAWAAEAIARPDGKPADMTKPVQVFILLGQSNMVGLGKVKGGDISLEHAVKEKKRYQYLVAAKRKSTWTSVKPWARPWSNC